MLEDEWKISKSGGQCSGCGSAFDVEQPVFSALFQEQDQLLRKDFCAECFQNRRPENVFYFWKTTAGSRSEGQPAGSRRSGAPAFDLENVLEFFKRLDGESGAQKIAFRYILALMLARKKMLVAGDKKSAEGQRVQFYREKGGGAEHAVVEPDLSADEIQGLSAELGGLLGLGEKT
ncbi:MAG TPA: hypothetical protein VKX17_07235 [Planctomycetota bacterium]|nr:hypothetical protein [Planctomycetota bacterium]